MAGASSHMLNFFPGGGVPEGRVYGRRLVFVSVRTIKRHHHQKVVSRLLEEQDKDLRAYFTQKGGARSQRGEGTHSKGREHVKWNMYA